MRTNSRLAFQLLAGFLFLGIAGLVVDHFIPRSLTYGQMNLNSTSARQLAIACMAYAAEHGGRFPVQLDELALSYAPNLTSLRGIARDANGENIYTFDWLYFGRGFTDDKPPAILIASPAVAATAGKPQHRVVIHGDFSPAVLDAVEYEKLLAETVRQMRELDDRQHPVQPASSQSPAK